MSVVVIGGENEMAEYIEKQAVMNKFAEVVAPSNNSDFARVPTWNDAVEIIEGFPPADVRPVVHGKWIPVTRIYRITEAEWPNTYLEWVDATESDKIDALKCSECREIFDFTEARNWCPECGAKMKGRGCRFGKED